MTAPRRQQEADLRDAIARLRAALGDAAAPLVDGLEETLARVSRATAHARREARLAAQRAARWPG